MKIKNIIEDKYDHLPDEDQFEEEEDVSRMRSTIETMPSGYTLEIWWSDDDSSLDTYQYYKAGQSHSELHDSMQDLFLDLQKTNSKLAEQLLDDLFQFLSKNTTYARDIDTIISRLKERIIEPLDDVEDVKTYIWYHSDDRTTPHVTDFWSSVDGLLITGEIDEEYR